MKTFFFNVLFCVMLFGSWSEANDNIIDKYYEKAIELQKEGNYSEAEEVFSIGLKKYPKAIKLYYFRAKLRSDYMDHCRDAVIDYNIVIKLNPKYNPKAYWRRGNCLCQFGLYQQAISDFTNCLKLKPTYGRVYIMRAVAYAKINMIPQAIADLKLGVKYDSKYASRADQILKKILAGEKDF